MKFIKLIFITIVLSIVALSSNAQNLVPNPSFELYDTCPYSDSQIFMAVPWQGITTNSSDYFNSCSSIYNVPFSGGFQYAKTGDAYGGIWVINGFGANYREYLRVKIDSILQADSCYAISFYCNLSNGVNYGIGKMGAYISNTAGSSVGPGSVLQYTPQIVSHTPLTDTLNWMRVSGYYHAAGGEQYITIGNFSTDINSDTTYIQHGATNASYYLIDDVSITKIPNCDTTLGTGINEFQKNVSFNLYPNPNNGYMTLEYKLNAADHATIQVVDITGKQIAKYKLETAFNKLQIDNGNLNNGIYFYQIIVNNQLIKREKIIIIK